jgi:hypothetical protein
MQITKAFHYTKFSMLYHVIVLHLKRIKYDFITRSIIKEKLKNVRIRKLKDGPYKGQTKINK